MSPTLQIAIEYGSLALDASLRYVIMAVRNNDEAHHRDVNHHQFSDGLS